MFPDLLLQNVFFISGTHSYESVQNFGNGMLLIRNSFPTVPVECTFPGIVQKIAIILKMLLFLIKMEE